MAIKKLSNNYTRFFDKVRKEVNHKVKCGKAVSRLQGWIIDFLFRESKNRDIFLKDIEKEFNIRRSTACNVVSRMENLGLIIRMCRPEDARFKVIKLTGKAFDDHLEARQDFFKAEKQATKGIDEEELRVFLAVCEKISNNLT